MLVNHRHHGRRGGQRNIDCVVGRWCRHAGRPFYVYTPSLAQHVGETSTLYAGATVTGIRGSTTFIGEEVDAAELEIAGQTQKAERRTQNHAHAESPI